MYKTKYENENIFLSIEFLMVLKGSRSCIMIKRLFVKILKFCRENETRLCKCAD